MTETWNHISGWCFQVIIFLKYLQEQKVSTLTVQFLYVAVQSNYICSQTITITSLFHFDNNNPDFLDLFIYLFTQNHYHTILQDGVAACLCGIMHPDTGLMKKTRQDTIQDIMTNITKWICVYHYEHYLTNTNFKTWPQLHLSGIL